METSGDRTYSSNKKKDKSIFKEEKIIHFNFFNVLRGIFGREPETRNKQKTRNQKTRTRKPENQKTRKKQKCLKWKVWSKIKALYKS